MGSCLPRGVAASGSTGQVSPDDLTWSADATAAANTGNCSRSCADGVLWPSSAVCTFPTMNVPRPPAAAESDVRGPLSQQSLRILAELTGCLHRGLSAEESLAEVAAILGRGLGTELSRIWVRTPDGAGFRAVTPLGVEPPPAIAADAARPWFAQPGLQRAGPGAPVVRMPLTHEGERLGLLEVGLPARAAATAVLEVVEITANVLALLIASVELSEDLASEIALRTREIESQRRFTSKIIDSLPLGLYVIDREYRIQAWNRKRETGAQGVVRAPVFGWSWICPLPSGRSPCPRRAWRVRAF